jgi:hypothetical protein
MRRPSVRFRALDSQWQATVGDRSRKFDLPDTKAVPAADRGRRLPEIFASYSERYTSGLGRAGYFRAAYGALLQKRAASLNH